MTQKYWEQKPTSFADIVRLTKNYVRAEIIKEVNSKQLYYHNLDHALAVERRALQIFQAIKPALLESDSLQQLERMECLISICGFAHDMVQIFEPTQPNQTRKRRSGLSEIETANKLIQYITGLNLALAAKGLDSSLQISQEEQQMIHDGIIATICIPDPQGSRSKFAFSEKSIYQPYLYNAGRKTTIVGRIIALADLGTLGIDGVEAYICDGILIFLEDNPHLLELCLNCDRSNNNAQLDSSYLQTDEIKAKLLAMTRIAVDFANERLARLEPEIADFSPQLRQILRDRVFIYLNQKNINLIKKIIPTHTDTSLAELIDFLNLSKIKLISDRQTETIKSCRSLY